MTTWVPSEIKEPVNTIKYIASMETVISRVDTLALFARAVREKYRDRIHGLYALSDHPFEEGDDETLYVVVQLDSHTWEDVDVLSKLAFSVQEQVDFALDITPFILDSGIPDDPLARLVSAEGVAL